MTTNREDGGCVRLGSNDSYLLENDPCLWQVAFASVSPRDPFELAAPSQSEQALANLALLSHLTT